jgi:Zn-dependent protease with chaperone function
MPEVSPAPVRRFPEISPKAYEHPADRAATAALASIPYLDSVVKRLVEFQYERALRQLYLGNAVKLGPRQLPHVHRLHLEVHEALDLQEEHDLYLAQWPLANAVTIGATRPIVVLNSELVTLLDEAQTKAVLAHEAAHILSEHVLYRTALEILLSLSRLGRLPFVAGLPIMAIRSALLEWYRASELSCDRAAALVAGDPRIVCRTLMTLAAGAEAEHLDLDAFEAQASQYDEWTSPFDRAQRFFSEIAVTHAFPVKRVSEVMAWVRAGDWDRIMGGDYVRRGQEPPAREEAGDAVSFYSDRFRDFFRDTGESVNAAGKQLADWLRGSGGADGDGEDSDDEPDPPN